MWGKSYFTDNHGKTHRRKYCSVQGCEHLRQLCRRYKPDGTVYRYEHKVCGHHKVDGSLNKHAHLDKQRQHHWKQMGIVLSTEEYNQILNLQNGRCALCDLHTSALNHRLCVDHDHSTGKIRGLICKSCNAMLAWLEKVSSLDVIRTFWKTDVFIKYQDKIVQTPELREVRKDL